MKSIPENVDRVGTNLTMFAKEVFDSGIDYGLTHILVDFPAVSGLTLADERSQEIRPVFIHITPPNLISWATKQTSSGQLVLTQIRFKEQRVEPVGQYGDELVNYIRIFNETTWELWKQDGDKYVMEDEGINSFGGIPMVTYYVNRKGPWIASPTLESLAWLNIAHWQSLSDQRNILRFARSGILTASGYKPEELESMTVGPNVLITGQDPEAKMAFVEHSGKAIGAGAADIQSLEERMEILGLQPLLERTSNSTATGKLLDESRSQSSIQSWIRSLEGVIKNAFSLAGEWLNVEVDATWNIFSDFGLSPNTDVEALIKIRAGEQITHETFLREIKRRGLLSESLDVQQEISDVENTLAIAPNDNKDNE